LESIALATPSRKGEVMKYIVISFGLREKTVVRVGIMVEILTLPA
jgi:hypothetical protein